MSILERDRVQVAPSNKTFYEQEIDRLYSEPPIKAKQYLLIRQSKAFMEKFHSENIELNDLAKAALMSRFHYVRIFKKALWCHTPKLSQGYAHCQSERLVARGAPDYLYLL